jgi:tetraacyldisaccharide 4'-kinase
LRELGYRRGFLKRRQLGRPVISVGNLTVGGTGKTPYVAYLARLLQSAQYQPAILSRGYRGSGERRQEPALRCRHRRR